MSDSAPPPPSRPWRVLRGPFLRYTVGESISMLGTWMQMLAQGWVVAGLTGSAFMLGMMNFASGIPMLIFTLWGGVLADRYDKRVIVMLATVVQAALAVAIGYLVSTGQIALWHVLTAGVLLGIAAAFDMPAISALVPELVEKEEIPAAIAVDRSLFHATRLAGPALGGWLIGTLGTASAFYVNALSFGAVIVALATIRRRPPGDAAEEQKRQTGMKEGFAYVRSDRPTTAMILLLTLSTACISPFFMIMLPLYSRNVLHLQPQQHGLLMACSGLGAFTGSVWLLSIARNHRTGWLRIALIVIVLAMAALSAAQGLAWAAVCMVTLTLGTSTVFGIANTIVQERAPDHLRGRISAVAGLSFFGVLPFAGLLSTAIADRVGLRTAMAGAAILYGICGALLLAHQRRGAATAA